MLTACGSSASQSVGQDTATSQTSSTASSSEATASSSSTETKPTVIGFSSSTYADKDHLEFAINGKVYRLGETTLQTLIDDGVPFDTSTLNNAGNTVNPNSQSDTFKIVLGDYWYLQIWVGNFTDAPVVAKDLPITDIYFPMKQDKTQDILTFNFSFDLTMEALKANSDEPTENRHYDGDGGFTSDNLDYRYESSQYISKYGYSFDFIKGRFDAVRLIYLPH